MITNQPRHIPYEISEKIPWRAISQSVCLWLNHRCILILFTRIRSVSRQFYQIVETLKVMLPTIYISDSTWLNQQPENRVVNAQRLIKRFGSHSGVILESERITASSKWSSGWVVLAPDVFGWIFVSYIFWRKQRWHLQTGRYKWIFCLLHFP